MKRWKATSILITILLIVAVIGGINYFARPLYRLSPSENVEETVSDTSDSLAEVKEPSAAPDRLIDQLSDSELAWQVLAVPLTLNQSLTQSDSASESSELLTQLPATPAGSITIFGEEISQKEVVDLDTLLQMTYSSASARTSNVWLGVDQEGGSVQRLSGDGFTTLPSWRSVCQSSEASQSQLAASSAAELARAGIDIVYSPVVDVASRSSIFGNRICSGDPVTVASSSARLIAAYQAEQILPVIKHYPGAGGLQVDLHNRFGSAQVTKADTTPFHLLLTQFPLIGVMTTHMSPERNGDDVCSRSYSCVSELTSVYPKALVVSDALEMKAALYDQETEAASTPLPQAALEALLAGNDLLLFGPSVTLEQVETVAAYLLFAADTDPAIKNRLEQAAEKVLSYKETR